MASNEQPGFAASDFDFPLTVMTALRQEGYQAAKELAKDLRDHPAWRAELAVYLNRLLNVAIGHLTTLTASDLKEMFSELRRELRQQRRGLALFIEDITAFTGIDRGLVDVLATQHTGEANQQFCRMLSVIGVTDSYYDDSFPTNIKERVTLHLSLNADADKEGHEAHEADLLRDEDARRDLAGRYLNAMRLDQDELDQWLEDGADPKRLPNACARCTLRTPCHAAFGHTSPRSGEEAQLIGLYPFNMQALTQFYANIKNTTLTPRSFLNNVLAYILHSYGDEILAGNFPPSPTELGRQFRVPLLRQPLQAQTISHQTQSVEEADRVESLLRLWGDRTAYRQNADGKSMVGGLPKEVFAAFDVPFIPGESADAPPPPPKPQDPPVKQPEPPEPKPRDETRRRYEEDIEAWRRGARLTYYDEFARRLIPLLRTAITWDAYGITREDVEEHLQKQHLVFEGQGAHIWSAGHILLERSSDMVAVLHSLLSLTDRVDPAAPSVAAGHLARLSAWLRVEEPRIVAFVENASGRADEELNTHDMLLLSAATLEVLYGSLDRRRDTPEALLAAILAHASEPPRATDLIAAATGIRNQAWVDAIQATVPTQELWKRLLSSLNRPQGRGADAGESGAEENSRRPVYFLDVAPALKTLDTLLRADWELPARTRTASNRSGGATPGSPARLYDDVRARFDLVLQDARQTFLAWKRELDEYFGQDSPVDALTAVTDLLHKFQRVQVAYPNGLDHRIEDAVIEIARHGVDNIAMERSRAQLALALSGALQLTKQARQTANYFRAVSTFLTAKSASLDTQLDGLRGASETQELTEQVQQEYSNLERMLAQDSESQVNASADAIPAERAWRGGTGE